MTTYAKNWDELIEKTGESHGTLVNFKRNGGFPNKTDKGWPVEPWIDFCNQIREERKKKFEASGTALDNLRAEKLTVEIDIAKEKLKELRGEVISWEDHLAEICSHAHVVKGVFEKWISAVSVLTKDAALVREAERLRDAALGHLREKVNDEEQIEKQHAG